MHLLRVTARKLSSDEIKAYEIGFGEDFGNGYGYRMIGEPATGWHSALLLYPDGTAAVYQGPAVVPGENGFQTRDGTPVTLVDA